jgi:hypothetical protein
MGRAGQVGFATGSLLPLLRNGQLKSQRCPSSVIRKTPIAALPREDRRAAEIQRLTAELERLRAQKNALGDRPAGGDEHRLGSASASHETRTAGDFSEDIAVKALDSGNTSVLPLLGKHSQGSRFCSVSTLDSKDYSTRIIAVAGRVPGVSASSVRNAPRLGGDGYEGESERGVIAWTTIPAEYSGEISPLPSSEVLGSAIDPIGLRVDPAHIGLAVTTERDALLVIERDSSQLGFDNIKIYAWDIEGEVHIGWLKHEPSRKQARCLGRVLCVFVEEDKDMKAEKSCWLEADQVF